MDEEKSYYSVDKTYADFVKGRRFRNIDQFRAALEICRERAVDEWMHTLMDSMKTKYSGSSAAKKKVPAEDIGPVRTFTPNDSSEVRMLTVQEWQDIWNNITLMVYTAETIHRREKLAQEIRGKYGRLFYEVKK